MALETNLDGGLENTDLENADRENTDLENTDLETNFKNVVCVLDWEASFFYKINGKKKTKGGSKRFPALSKT